MKVYLIRHTSVDVEPGTCYGQTDVALRSTFKEEASVCKARIPNVRFDKVYTSPLSRCTLLAGFCGYAQAIRDKRLMEINFGAWEMKKFEDIQDPHLQKWYADYLNIPAREGESFKDLYTRVSGFLDDVKKRNYENVLIFAHGGVLICALIYAGLIEFDQAFDALPAYGGMVELDI